MIGFNAEVIAVAFHRGGDAIGKMTVLTRAMNLIVIPGERRHLMVCVFQAFVC